MIGAGASIRGAHSVVRSKGSVTGLPRFFDKHRPGHGRDGTESDELLAILMGESGAGLTAQGADDTGVC